MDYPLRTASFSSTPEPKPKAEEAPLGRRISKSEQQAPLGRRISKGEQQTDDELSVFIKDQIARHKCDQASRLEELLTTIIARVQIRQNKLDSEMEKLRKENAWWKAVPPKGSANGRRQSHSGGRKASAETCSPRPSLSFQPRGSLEVLDLEMTEPVTLSAVRKFGSSDANDVSPPPAPLSNNLLTAVVPLPKEEAPTTAPLPKRKPKVEVVKDDVSVHDFTDDNDEAGSKMAHIRSVTSYYSEPAGFSVPMDEGSVDSSSDVAKNDFKVLQVWTERHKFKSGRGTRQIEKMVSQDIRQSVADFGEMEALETVHNPFEDRMFRTPSATNNVPVNAGGFSYVIHPNGVFRGFWDMTSLVLVFYDLVFIPLMLLDLPESWFGATVAWTTRIFWTVDLFLSPITGYIVPDGSIEMRPRKIFQRYLKSWLAIDVFIVTVDWLEIFWAAGSGLGFARIGKASRVFRILRLVRLLRLIRMLDIMREFLERIHSERLVILANIFKIMVVICGLAHLMACIWYGMGNKDDSSRTWVHDQLLRSDSLQYKYMTALHWSVSQFSGGMDEVRPQNFWERVYAILCFLMAFIMAGVFISSITSSMTQLHFLSSRKSQQITVLRRFLLQHGISHRLAIRVQRNATHAIDQQQRYMPECNVELLQLVSTPLRSRVHFEMYAPTFSVHPFFAKYVENCPHVMRRVCHSASSMVLTSCSDVIFNAGEIAAKPAMYIVCTGILNYVSLSGKKYSASEDTVLAEAVLWTTWMHQGTLTAETNSHLMLLDAHGFQYIVTQFEHMDFNPRDYALEFVQDLNEQERELSDLPKHMAETEGIAVDLTNEFSSTHSKRRKGDRIFGMRHAKSIRVMPPDNTEND